MPSLTEYIDQYLSSNKPASNEVIIRIISILLEDFKDAHDKSYFGIVPEWRILSLIEELKSCLSKFPEEFNHEFFNRRLAQFIEARWHKEFKKFIDSGEASPEFMKYLDDNPTCQKAVEIAYQEKAKGLESLAKKET